MTVENILSELGPQKLLLICKSVICNTYSNYLVLPHIQYDVLAERWWWREAEARLCPCEQPEAEPAERLLQLRHVQQRVHGEPGERRDQQPSYQQHQAQS